MARQGDIPEGHAARLSQENVRPGELPDEDLRRGSEVEGPEAISGIEAASLRRYEYNCLINRSASRLPPIRSFLTLHPGIEKKN